MMAWMVYALLVAAALSAGALCAERAARVHRRATRWIWLLALAASLCLPVLIASVSLRVPGMLRSGAMPPPLALRDATSIPMPALLVELGGAHAYGTPDRVAAILRAVWALLSLLMLVALASSAVLLRRRRRRWSTATLCAEPVLVAADTGPAVAGLLHPRIVVPAWLLEASERQQRAVMAHEGSHLRAGDPRLIALALLLLVAMPWNPLLWWQFARLRRAIEIDCDARVLRDGGDLGEYCETLIEVGQQASRGNLMPAMARSGSFLEQRIRLMLSTPSRWAGLSALLLVCVSLGMAAVAAQVTPPGSGHRGRAATVMLPPSVLDRYVGDYRVSAISRVRVTRQGAGLRLVVSAQPAAPRPQYALPLGADRFAVQGTSIRLRFRMDTRGRVRRLIATTHGRVFLDVPRVSHAEGRRIDAALAARVKAQKPYAGSGKALRLLLSDPVGGAGMSASLAQARARQRASRERYLARLGPVQSYAFTGVNRFGDDVYRVRHLHGNETVMLAVGRHGTLETAFRHR